MVRVPVRAARYHRVADANDVLAALRCVVVTAVVSACALGCFSIVDVDSFHKRVATNSAVAGASPFFDLRMTFANMRPHGGHLFEYRAVDANNFIQSRGVVKAMASGDTTINVARAVPKVNGPYRLDFYADVNRSGGFDGLGSVISNDHAWRIEPLANSEDGLKDTAPVDGLVQTAFLHNTSFTNIDQYPSGTPNPALDTTLPAEVRIDGLAAFVGKLVELRIADKSSGHVVCLFREESLGAASLDAIVPGCVDVETEYLIDVYVDANGDQKYDDPSVAGGDLGFRIGATSGSGGLRQSFDASDLAQGTVNVGAP
jgi:hypothetical protein